MEPNLEVTSLITPFVNFYKKLSNEWKHLMDIGIAGYLDSQTEKFYYTNTFLHRQEKVKFHEIYYPIKANYKALTTDFSNLGELLEDYKSILLIGSAGSGKSTLIRHIYLNAIKDQYKIPVLIELRNLNDYQGDLEKLITEKILKLNIKPSDHTLKKTLKSGRFLFLLDGYDEIFSSRKEEIKRQIELFADCHHNNRFLMTSRPGSGIESFPRFHNFNICRLEKPDIIGFLDKMVTNIERNQRIKKVVGDAGNRNYVHYLGNPLLLSMFILSFETHPEIPTRKSAFYRNVFDTLYSKHDGITKNSFARERLTSLQREDFEEILSKFSYLTLCKGHYAFTYELLTDSLKKVRSKEHPFKIEDLITDLQTSISILIQDGLEFKFPHRSMQEYFAALFISNLSPDKKIRAYDNVLTVFTIGGPDGSFEFWDLCREQDWNYFTSKFALPELKWYAKLLERDSEVELIAEFGVLWGICLADDSDEIEQVIFARSGGSLFNAFIDYYKLIDHVEIHSFPQDAGSAKELSELLIKRNVLQLDFLREDEEFLNILLKYNFSKYVKKYRSNLNKLIVSLEAEISRKADDVDEILNLS